MQNMRLGHFYQGNVRGDVCTSMLEQIFAIIANDKKNVKCNFNDFNDDSCIFSSTDTNKIFYFWDLQSGKLFCS